MSVCNEKYMKQSLVNACPKIETYQMIIPYYITDITQTVYVTYVK